MLLNIVGVIFSTELQPVPHRRHHLPAGADRGCDSPRRLVAAPGVSAGGSAAPRAAWAGRAYRRLQWPAASVAAAAASRRSSESRPVECTVRPQRWPSQLLGRRSRPGHGITPFRFDFRLSFIVLSHSHCPVHCPSPTRLAFPFSPCLSHSPLAFFFRLLRGCFLFFFKLLLRDCFCFCYFKALPVFVKQTLTIP